MLIEHENSEITILSEDALINLFIKYIYYQVIKKNILTFGKLKK